MGRYSLDEPGLIYAHAGNVGFEATRYKTFPADPDGIVPLTEELWFEDDAANRVREFLLAVWGSETLDENMAWLAESLGQKGNETPDETIRRYLSSSFFKDHLQTYKRRPIYWLFSSGKQGAFQALVYLHRYNESTLARMRAEYVVPLTGKIQSRIEMLEKDAESASTAARNKLDKEIEKLRKKHVELLAYDEKLRHYADMRIQIDLDDGVKVNYGKFGDLLAEVKAVTGGLGMNSPAPEGLLSSSAREEIEAKTRGEIEVYVDGRGKTRIHEGARNLSLNVSDDYGDRFLVELIQNAHDAHPSGSQDGEIAVVFDPTECEFGCLYVANRGNGFSKENFLAITNIALSSKPVNESIGNKGLGFRSVLQICKWPEIYSVSGAGDSNEFDGYCFRFANAEDVASFLNGTVAQGLAEEILANMPCWYLPVYASERPGLVSRFSSDGFSSVVRLPLESAAAQESVVSQLASLFAKEQPLHLFLDRIARIVIEPNPGERKLLERQRLESWHRADNILIERLHVGGEQYLMANYTLEEAVFRKQLCESLAKKEVPEAWSNWQGAAKVSVAVRLGRSVESGLLYCFLPLGDGGKAPFAGYINANFYTKIDRRSVDERIGLNRFFIRIAAILSSRTIDFLIEKNWPEAPGAVVDLLCWNHPYSNDIRTGLKAGESDMLDRRLLPVLTANGETSWEEPRKTVLWNAPSNRYLSSDALIQVSTTQLLHPEVTTQQQDSLSRFFLATGVDFKPSAKLISEWVESVAEQLVSRNLPGEAWADFYDEIAGYIGPSEKVLFGRKFLLGVNGDLIAAEVSETGSRRRRAADVYFPPVMTIDAEVDDAESRKQLPLERFPASLQKGFALLSRDIPWNNPGGGYRPCRAYFLEAKLVREYDTREAIRTLANITQSDSPEKLKQQALEWAFRLWSSGRSLSDKETRSAGFFVPTRNAWRPAESAMFGSGWSGVPSGKRLETFLKAAGERSAELESTRAGLLPIFSEWPIGFGKEDDWSRFLRAAGVMDHLRPIGAEEGMQKDQQPYSLAYDLTRSIASISEPAAKLWLADLQAVAQTAKYSTVNYRADCVPWRIPGQCELDGLPVEVRKEFAYQVIRVVSSLEEEHLYFRVFRPGKPSSGQAPMTWPTPSLAFSEKPAGFQFFEEAEPSVSSHPMKPGTSIPMTMCFHVSWKSLHQRLPRYLILGPWSGCVHIAG